MASKIVRSSKQECIEHMDMENDQYSLVQWNRPIVLLRPGHEVRGISAVWSCKKHWFCTFLRHFLGLAWLWTTVFFFSLLERHSRWLMMCSSSAGTWKESRFERLSPLLELPVSRHCSGSCRIMAVVLTWAPQGWHSRRTIHITLGENASLDNKNARTERQDVCLQVRVPRESAVIFEAGSVHRLVGYTCIATEHSPELQRSIPTKQAHHLQNRKRNQTLVHLIFFYSHFKKKKKKKLLLLSCQRAKKAELISARRCTWSTSLLVLRAKKFLARKISVFKTCQAF